MQVSAPHHSECTGRHITLTLIWSCILYSYVILQLSFYINVNRRFETTCCVTPHVYPISVPNLVYTILLLQFSWLAQRACHTGVSLCLCGWSGHSFHNWTTCTKTTFWSSVPHAQGSWTPFEFSTIELGASVHEIIVVGVWLGRGSTIRSTLYSCHVS